MGIQELARNTMDRRLFELRGERERLLGAQARLEEVNAEIAEIEALVADADNGKATTIQVAKREAVATPLPIAIDLPIGKNAAVESTTKAEAVNETPIA